jgi:hypothetical protein
MNHFEKPEYVLDGILPADWCGDLGDLLTVSD